MSALRYSGAHRARNNSLNSDRYSLSFLSSMKADFIPSLGKVVSELKSYLFNHIAREVSVNLTSGVSFNHSVTCWSHFSWAASR